MHFYKIRLNVFLTLLTILSTFLTVTLPAVFPVIPSSVPSIALAISIYCAKMVDLLAKYAFAGRASEMISLSLHEIERSIRALSLKEQLWLLERIAGLVREKQQTVNLFADEKYMQQQLRAMAINPDIIGEIAAINEEFAMTEMDGLDSSSRHERD